MRFQNTFNQTDLNKVNAFIDEQPYGMLQTVGAEGRIHCGIFNHAFDGKDLFLHLNKADEQIADLKANPRALFVIHEFGAIIPSYWVDSKYAGAATSYYRYVELDCRAEVIIGMEELTPVFQKLMDHFQPEGRYEKLDPRDKIYTASYEMLAVVRLTPTFHRARWKLGQNRSVEHRKQVVAHLRERGLPNDSKTADLVMAEISETP